MIRNYRLLSGPLAAIILGFGIGGLALLIPGYSHVHQTVSEIGEIGSPARVPSPFVAPVWVYVKPVHGLAQRALFAAWFGWCAVVGILLFNRNWQSSAR